MTVEELGDWYTYRNKRMLPHRRFEYYIAQLTLHVASANGGKYVFRDFLFDEKHEQKTSDTAETGVAAINAVAGGVRVVRLGQKGKKSG